MSRRLASVVLVAASVWAAAACGRGGAIAQAAEEIARATGSSVDDVTRTAERESGVTGSSSDDILRRWRGAVTAGAEQEWARYREVPQDVRSFTCDTVTDVLVDALDGDARTDPSPLEAAVDAVAALSPTAGAQALLKDLQAAKADLDAGRPATLNLLVLRTGACEVAGS
jgi:hypothetical protein